MTESGQEWWRDIYDALVAAGIRQVAYVPDAGHAELIRACHADASMRATVLTTEEEGIGLLAGAHLGGDKGVLLMQSSGVGNCINTLSLVRVCGFPLLMLVTMRGEWGEFNPWQVPMGQAVPASLELADVIVHRVDRPEDVGPTLRADLSLAFDSNVAVAVLLSQRLLGTKKF